MIFKIVSDNFNTWIVCGTVRFFFAILLVFSYMVPLEEDSLIKRMMKLIEDTRRIENPSVG